MPVRYMVPPGYRQPSPPFANQAFNRYGVAPPNPYPAQNMSRFPPGYVQPVTRMPSGPIQQTPVVQSPQLLQPPEPYYYNPYGSNQPDSVSIAPSAKTTSTNKTGAKEYKEKAFTIAPDGLQSDTIKGLVSNDNINNLLKHKGTKVKVSKIYRITKTKPDIKPDSSSDDDDLLLTKQPPPPPPQAQQSQTALPPPSQESQRPVSSSSSCSTCSTCSSGSFCSECNYRSRSHTYDDCPECRAEREREHGRRRRHK